MPRLYAESKLAQVLFTKALSRRLENTGVVVHSLHPGFVKTELFWKGEGIYRILGWISRPVGMSEEEGAKTSLYAALADESGRVSGRYYDECREMAASAATTSLKLQEELWTESEKACGLRNP